MSTEPERPIEKQLKAYANKRRAEAGAPFEMHPATRRLLHGEIARKTSRAPSGLLLLTKVFFQIWPRFAYVIVFLVLGISVIVYKVSDHKESNQLANNAPTSSAQSVDETRGKVIASTTIAEVAKVESQVGPPASIPSELQKQKADFDNQLAAAPQTAERNGIESRNGPAENLNLKPPVALARKEAVRRPSDANIVPTPTAALSAAPLPGKPAAPSSSADFYTGKETDRLNPERSSVASATQGFARVDALQQRGTDRGHSELKAVLLSFQMEQTGDRVRVTDRDGSTYAGYLQKVDATSEQQPADGKDRAANLDLKTKALTATPSSKLEEKFAYEANRDYFFRVEGTNRSLNQQVIFTGHLLANTGNADSPKNYLNTTAAKQAQLPLQKQTGSLLLNSRINGTALVGASNTVEIQAVPIAPK